MKNVLLCLLFSFLLCLATHTFAQEDSITKKEIIHLDSLMYAGDFKEIQIFFMSKDSEYGNKENKMMDYERLKNSYLSIIDHVNPMSRSENKEVLTQKISHFKKSKDSFQRNFAGEKAYDIYERFLEAAGKKTDTETYKLYYVAYFFKGKYIRAKVSKIREQIRLGYSFLEQNDFATAKRIIEQINLDANSNIYFSALVDSLKDLANRVEKRIAIEDRRDWSKNKPISMKGHITFGSTFFYRNPVHGGNLFFISEGNLTNASIASIEISPSFAVGYHLAVQYNLFGNLNVGWNMLYNRFNYKSQNIRKLYFFDFHVKRISSHFYFDHLFRNTTGVRPFVGLGAGMLYSKRNKSGAAILSSEDGVKVSRFYLIDKKTTKTSRILFRLGIEFIPRKLNKIIFGSNLSIYYNFKKDAFVNRGNYSFSISAGLVL